MNQKSATFFIIVLLLLSRAGLSAQSLDTLNDVGAFVESELINKLDSINRFGSTRYTQLQASYDSIRNHASVDIDRIYVKIDSLQKRGLATDRLTAQLDRLLTLKDKSVRDITSKVEDLTSAMNSRINELDLPPALQEKADKLTSMMNKLDLAKPNSIQEYLEISSLDLGSIETPTVPGFDLRNQLTGVPNMDMPSIETGSIGTQIKDYQGTIADLPPDLDGAVTLAEEQAGKTGEINSVEAELGKVGELTQSAAMLQDEEKLKKEIVQEVQIQATDHLLVKQNTLKMQCSQFPSTNRSFQQSLV